MILQFSEHAFIDYFSVIRRRINRPTHNFANAILFRILTINEIESHIVLTIHNYKSSHVIFYVIIQYSNTKLISQF